MAERVGLSSRPDRSRLYGVVICGVTLAIAASLLEGMRRRSYWALAAPLLVGSLGILSVAFWIGWSLAMTRLQDLTPQPDSAGTPAGRRPRSARQPSAN
jgi:hypothetical protein